jgi:lysophospholipase L1-like esterase
MNTSLSLVVLLSLLTVGFVSAAGLPGWVSSERCEQIKTNTAFLASLDAQVQACWKTLNFSTLSPAQILDAAMGYAAMRKFDHLELAKRAFMHEIQRLTQRVITASFPKYEKDLGVFLPMSDAFSILQGVGGLSWMEQEEAYTVLRLSASRFGKMSLAAERRAELTTGGSRLALDFAPRQADSKQAASGYALEDGDVVVFFGDSITSGYGPTPRAIDIYPRELEKLHRIAYPERKVLFINLGKGGEGIAGATARAHEVALFRPTKVFLGEGGNGPLTPEFGDSFLKLLAEVKTCAPGARVYVLSLPFPDDNLPLSQKGPYFASAMEQKQKALNDVFKKMPEGVVAIDLLTPMKGILAQGKSKHGDYTLHEPLDGVHPYEAGATFDALQVFHAIGGELPRPLRGDAP